MASTNPLSNVAGTGLASWNGLPHEVIKCLIHKYFNILYQKTLLYTVSFRYAYWTSIPWTRGSVLPQKEVLVLLSMFM